MSRVYLVDAAAVEDNNNNNKERFVIAYGDALRDLVHIDGEAHIVKRTLLPCCHVAAEWDGLLERVVPLEVGV